MLSVRADAGKMPVSVSTDDPDSTKTIGGRHWMGAAVDGDEPWFGGPPRSFLPCIRRSATKHCDNVSPALELGSMKPGSLLKLGAGGVNRNPSPTPRERNFCSEWRCVLYRRLE